MEHDRYGSERWRELFDAHLRCDYGITIEDSGLDNWTLWDWRESYPNDPAAAVRAYGEKYDLTLIRAEVGE